MIADLDVIKKVYERYPERIAAARQVVGKSLTLAEETLYTHLKTLSFTGRHYLSH